MTKDKALKAIRNAWIFGIISASITLLMTILTFSGYKNPDRIQFSLFTLIDVFILLGMSYGISRKSRVCSTSLFIYFILNKLYFLVALRSIAGWPVSLVFLYFFYQGMRGTYRYHKIIKEEEAVEAVQGVPEWAKTEKR
jgi:hypothetical protein